MIVPKKNMLGALMNVPYDCVEDLREHCLFQAWRIRHATKSDTDRFERVVPKGIAEDYNILF